MRPIYLKMKAFGPYAEETMVDFDQLGTGIYLISGDTGAGKTTIFDGIVYGLFGESSGDKREGEMMHCDFCSKEEPMVVELKFEHQKKEYIVKRTIRFRKKRGTDEYGSIEQLAELIENNEVAVNKSVAVSKRIEEIIGLNADQFRKIVMLAQGEFKAFLEADEKSRNQILGKLFDNRPYVYFENQFFKACEELSNRSGEARKQVDHFIASPGFVLPKNLSLEEKAGFQSTHPNFIENLEALVEKDDFQKANLEESIRKENEVLDEIKNRESKANLQNKQMKLLEVAKEKKEELAALSPQMAEIKKKIESMEKALRIVFPMEQKKKIAISSYEEAKRKQAEYQEQKDIYQKEKEKLLFLQKEWEDVPEKISKFGHQIETIKDSLEQYDNLEKCQLEKKEKELLLEKSKSELVSFSKEVEALKEKQQDIKKEIENLSSSEKEYLTSKQQHENGISKFQKVQGKDGLFGQIEKANDLEKKYKASLEATRRANEEAREAENLYRSLYQAFLDGQSVMLGQELEAMVKENGEAECPVCHTKIKAFHRNLSEVNYPTKEELEIKEQEKKKASQHFNECDGNQKILWTKLEAQKEMVDNLCIELSSLFEKEESYESLRDLSLLKQVIERLEEENKDLNRLVEKLQKKTLRFTECNELIPKLEESIRNKDEKVEEKKSLIQKTATELASLEATVKELLKLLAYEDKKTALKEISLLEGQKIELEQKLSDLTSKISRNAEKLSSLEGQMKENESNLVSLEKDCLKTTKEWEGSLKKAHFATNEEYQAVITQLGGMDGEIWITEKNENLLAYNQSVIRNEQEIATLSEQTKDLEEVDLTVLTKEKEAQIFKCNELMKEKEELMSIASGHGHALELAKDCFGKMERLQKAYLRLSRLSDIANGVRTEGGRKSFDAYVMLHSFDEILEMANVHLDHMSGGKYMLVRQDKGNRKDSIAGMNIDVIDAFTGEQRKTATLSGGESFQVSMALALGLSSVVQAHSGNTRIDATFIDEGFGSLDEKVLDKAIEVLTHLAGDCNQIGIISHVAKLEESIPKKILVTGSEKGSRLEIIQ